MSPIQRDGMEYEFTVFIDLDQQHTATATKDRTTLFDGQYFVPTIETGRTLLAWLENNGQAAPGEVAQEKPFGGRQREETRGDRGKVGAAKAEAFPQKVATQQAGSTGRDAASVTLPPAGQAVQSEKGDEAGKDSAAAVLSPRARQTGETGKPSAAATPQGEVKQATPVGMSNGLKTLFAKIGALDLPREGYKRYCYKRCGTWKCGMRHVRRWVRRSTCMRD